MLSLQKFMEGKWLPISVIKGERKKTKRFNELYELEKKSGCNEIKYYKNFSKKIKLLKKRKFEFFKKMQEAK